MVSVAVIPALEDNFIYYVFRPENPRRGLFVDVGEVEPFLKFREEFGLCDLSSPDPNDDS